MVEFNKKITPDKNVIISNIYPDMYLAKTSVGKAKIGGGKKDQAFLSRFTLPSQPLYGSGELKKLQYNFYVNDIELADNIYSLPEVSIFKTKNAERVTITEGAQQINDAQTKDMTIFSSHINGFSSIETYSPHLFLKDRNNIHWFRRKIQYGFNKNFICFPISGIVSNINCW